MANDVSDVGDVAVGPEGTPSIETLEAELDRLRAENAQLSSMIEETGSERRGAGRMFAAAALLVIGVLLLGLAVPAIWLNRTVMQTDKWVETVAPLADDPVIQNAVADRATTALFGAIDVEGIARSVLPTAADILAAPIANAAQGFVSDQAHKFVQSDAFKNAWAEINRTGHTVIIEAVTGHQGVVSSNQGKITLDLGLLLEKMQQQLVDQGFGLASKIPVNKINKEFVLVDSPALAQAGRVVDLMNTAALWIPLLGLAAVAGAIGVATDRRKIILWLGVGIIVVMILPLEAIYLARYPFVQAASQLGVQQDAVTLTIYDTVLRGLVTAQRMGIVTGIVVWLAALVAGPARWAVSLRRGVQHGLRGIGADWDFGAFGEWVLAHKTGLRTGGLIVAVLIFLAVQGKTPAFIIWLAIGVVFYILLLEFFGRPRPLPDTGGEAVMTEAPEIAGEAGQEISGASEPPVGESAPQTPEEESPDEPSDSL